MMLTNVINKTSAALTPRRNEASQKVVIVNGGNDVLEVFETVLDAGHYDVVFVEAIAHAYSQIKKIQPNLVIICLRLNDEDGFQVLSMLNLDAGTRGIPVLTYTSDSDSDEEDDIPEFAEDEIFAPRAEPRMN